MPTKRRSCASCTIAKTKCTWEGGSSRCYRCLRLNKVCGAELDQEVLALKRKSRGSKAIRSSRTSPWSNGTEEERFLPTGQISPNESRLSLTKGPSSPRNNTTDYDACLARFRSQMVHQFPFVVIPPYMSAKDVQLERPLTFQAIMMAACDTPKEQVDYSVNLRKELAHQILVEGRRNLDILSAILVAAAWHHVHLDVNFQITNFLALGNAMLTDLQLTVNPHRENRRLPDFPGRHNPASQNSAKERTLEERRILLGFHYLCTFTLILFKRVESIRGDTYHDECCQILDITQQHPTDSYLVYLARLAKQAQSFGLILDPEERPSRLEMSMTEWEVVQNMKQNLDTFRNIYSSSMIAKNVAAEAHIQLVEMYFYELVQQFHNAEDEIRIFGENPVHKCKSLAMKLINTTIVMTSGPPSSWTWIQLWHLSHSMVVLYRLAHSREVTDQVEYPYSLLDNVMVTVERALINASDQNHAAVNEQHNIYLRGAQRMRLLRRRYEEQRSIDTTLRSHLPTKSIDTYDASDEDYDTTMLPSEWDPWFATLILQSGA